MSGRLRTMLGTTLFFGVIAVVSFTVFGSPRKELEESEASSFVPPVVNSLAERKIPFAKWTGTASINKGRGVSYIGQDKRKFALSPGGERLVIEDTPNNRIEVWEVGRSTCLARFGETEGSSVLCFSPDGKTVVHGTRPDRHEIIELWEVAAQKKRQLGNGQDDAYVLAIAFSPDARTLAVADFESRNRGESYQTVCLRDATNGTIVKVLSGIPQGGQRSTNTFVSALAFSADGRSLALAAGERLYLWDPATGQEQKCLGTVSINVAAQGRSGSPVAALAFSPDGRFLALGCNDGAVRRWDLSTGKELPPYLEHSGPVRAVSYAADSKSILSFGLDGRVLTWPAGDPTREWKPEGFLSTEALKLLWDPLAGDDVRELYGAAQFLIARPKTSIPFLKGLLKPVPQPDRARLAKLVDALADPDYNERKKAAADLREYGELALPVLRAKEEHRYPVVERWRKNIEDREPTSDEIRALRVVGILEQIGTGDARQFLDDLSKGATDAAITENAKLALLRLAHK